MFVGSVREVRFKLADMKAYDEKALIAAFAKADFPDTSVKQKPVELTKKTS